MKNIITLILLSVFSFTFSQTTQKEEELAQGPSSNMNKDQFKASDTIYTPAEFPGGVTALREYISSHLNTSKYSDLTGTFKTVTTFDISSDGSISSISTTGNIPILNEEMDRMLKKLKKKWIPATKNGQPIKSKYKLSMGHSL